MEAIVLFWLGLSVAVAILANRYNRHPVGWLLVSVLFSPIIGAAFVLALGPLTRIHMDAGYQPSAGDTAPGVPPEAMTDAYRQAQAAWQNRMIARSW